MKNLYTSTLKITVQLLKPDCRLKHWIGAARAWVDGERGVLETDVIISLRNHIDGHLFDIASRARFYDLVEKRDGAWKIVQWKMIYDADRMDAVYPGQVPQSFYKGIDLSGYPQPCAYLCLFLEKSGRAPAKKIATFGSADETAIKAQGRKWLKGGGL